MSRSLLPALMACLAVPDVALACGGFFCSQVPIDQSKERIVFEVDPASSTVEAHVQIYYTGAAAEFAWVVPTPGLPEIGLSVDALFDTVSTYTQPRYDLTYEYPGCAWRGDSADSGSVLDSGGRDDTDAPSGGGVVIIDQTQVGPYDTVTLQASSDEALLTWLRSNDYDLPANLGPNLAPYVAAGSYFVALKLTNGRTAGDIAPIRLTWPGEVASIPLVLTAIAATPDMRLEAYVLGEHRAVPDNYLHVMVNDKAIDWLRHGANYDAVITDAADEAGGQAFATDYAGSTAALRDTLWSPGRYDLDLLRATDDPADYVSAMLSMGFPRSQQVQGLIRQFIPMPQAAIDAGIREQWFYNCLDCYPRYTRLIDFDPAAFTAALQAAIVDPLEQINRMFYDHAWITRLTSSISPAEMTVDPLFVLNPDLPAVDNVHRATFVTDCETSDGDPTGAVKWIELEDSTRLLLDPTSEATYVSTTSAAVVQDLDATGAGFVLVDNRAADLAAAEAFNAAATAGWEALGREVPPDDTPPVIGEIDQEIPGDDPSGADDSDDPEDTDAPSVTG
ncbi:MAG TPA: DUF2330 domain-containing protein, partial [Myxococcota bacterium]|nr:DUF2330 domain-containing protein [Myxococcota bacterium]